MKDIIKCILANKFSLISSIIYPLITCALIVYAVTTQKALRPIALSSLILFIMAVSYAGMYLITADETRKWYYRTKDHIKRYGRIDRRYAALPKTYCNKVGFNLALKEARIAKEVIS